MRKRSGKVKANKFEFLCEILQDSPLGRIKVSRFLSLIEAWEKINGGDAPHRLPPLAAAESERWTV